MAGETKPKIIWKKVVRTVMIPFCPKCGGEMEEEKNIDARTLWWYKCTKCDYKH